MLFRRSTRVHVSAGADVHRDAFIGKSDVMATHQGEDVVLLDSDAGRYHLLNETSARAWELLASGATAKDIARVIRVEFEIPSTVSPDAVERDVAALLLRLTEAGLVRPMDRHA